MTQIIQIKSSTTPGNVPGLLQTGELAINVTDGSLFFGSATTVHSSFKFSGLTMSGDIAMGTNTITGLGDPISAQDGATKAYVDSQSHDVGTLQQVTTAGATSNVAITLSNDLTVGVNGTGHDVKFFGDTTEAYMLWDQSDDKLIVTGEIEATKFDGALEGNADTATKIDSITNTDIVQLDDTQTLTNKTLTTPTITSISNSGTVTIPTGADTLVARTSTDTLTNKTLTAPTFTDPVLGQPDSGDLTNCTGYPAAQLPSSIDATKIADGTVTNTEFQFINTLSSNAQTQINTKQATITTNSIAWDKMVNLTASRAVYTNGNGDITVSDITSTELGYLDGVSSSIQTQITARLELAGGTMSGPIAMGTSKITGMGDPTSAQDAATKAYVDSQSHNPNTLQEVTDAGAVTDQQITTNGLVSSGIVDITNTTEATDATGDTGALRTEGGASIAKRLHVGGGVIANLTGNASTATLASTANVATTVTVTDNESTNENNVIAFVAGGGAASVISASLESDGNLRYNPSTGKVTATGFVGDVTGDITGNAATAYVRKCIYINQDCYY